MKVTVRHTYPFDPGIYWETLYGHRPFIEALYTEGLDGEDLQILAWRDSDDGSYSRALSFMPKMNAPKAVKKVLGARFRCEERGQYDPTRGAWRFEYISGSMASKISIHGEHATHPHTEGCEVVSTLDIQVSILGVGRLVERTIARQFERDMCAQATFIRRWVDDRPDLKTP
ncbi:MAG: DUF2505 family protein [Myxococcota bacterium]|nr:DUF2505 family protein [Myxococcota bacterium]